MPLVGVVIEVWDISVRMIVIVSAILIRAALKDEIQSGHAKANPNGASATSSRGVSITTVVIGGVVTIRVANVTIRVIACIVSIPVVRARSRKVPRIADRWTLALPSDREQYVQIF